MTRKAPGKHYRKGLSFVQVMDLFPDDVAAQEWIESQVWPDGPFCPKCGSVNIQTPIKHRSMTHRCRDCPDRYQFSLKTGTAMQGTKLGYRVWAIAIYLISSNLKGVSSMKLHRDLDITQKTAWHLAHRIRESWVRESTAFAGPAEADEAYFGGKRANMSTAEENWSNVRRKTGPLCVMQVAALAVVPVVHRRDPRGLRSVRFTR